MDEPRQVPGLRLGERRDHPAVQRAPAQRGQALLDGAAGQLVAEREAVVADLQHALLLGLGQRVEPRAEQLPGQAELDGRGHDGQLLDRVAARRGSSRPTRASTASDTVAGTVSPGAARASVT